MFRQLFNISYGSFEKKEGPVPHASVEAKNSVPAATDPSDKILKGYIFDKSSTCVPPHNSIDTFGNY